jgi:hypothetical protein
MTALIKDVAAMRLISCSVVMAVWLVFLHFTPLLIKKCIKLMPKPAVHLECDDSIAVGGGLNNEIKWKECRELRFSS